MVKKGRAGGGLGTGSGGSEDHDGQSSEFDET